MFVVIVSLIVTVILSIAAKRKYDQMYDRAKKLGTHQKRMFEKTNEYGTKIYKDYGEYKDFKSREGHLMLNAGGSLLSFVILAVFAILSGMIFIISLFVVLAIN